MLAFFRRRSSNESLPYHPLTSTSLEDESVSYMTHYKEIEARPLAPSRLTIWAIIICVCCTFLNLAILFRGNTSSTPYLSQSYQNIDTDSLRRPSQFIGLDTIERPAITIPRNFTSYPIVLAQIDKARPDNVYNDDPKRYMSRVGTISPEDRRVQISSTVSTIAQFRAIDFGMEICEIRLQLGEQSTESTLTFSPSTPRTISIYRLKVTKPLQTKVLSYNTRPQRVFKVTDVTLDYGSFWNRRFDCKTDELLSFEVAHSAIDEGYQTGNASVEWWQHKDGPKTAIFMIQHATV